MIVLAMFKNFLDKSSIVRYCFCMGIVVMTPLVSNPTRNQKIMSNLVRFDNDGLELVIDSITGEAFATQSGYARMVGLERNTITQRCKRGSKGCDISSIKSAEILTPGGLQGVTLIPADVVFDWAMKDSPELAKAMGKAGATVYLHKLAGYDVKSTAVEPITPQTYLEALKALVASEEEKERLKLENAELMEEVEQLTEVVDELFDYSSIIRVAKFNGVSEKSFSWRKLKQASELKEVEIKKVPCPRYGTKNLYNHSAWLLAYPEVKLPETTYLRKI
jgi:hypothetical protein